MIMRLRKICSRATYNKYGVMNRRHTASVIFAFDLSNGQPFIRNKDNALANADSYQWVTKG